MNIPTLRKIRYWLCDLLCPGRVWNQDISLENDRLIIANEDLREQLAALEGKGGNW